MQSSRLKICLVSYSGGTDEGIRGVTTHLTKELAERHEVKHVDLRTIHSLKQWREVKNFHPQIIHYIPGPSIFSFIIMKVLKLYCPHSKTVMSAINPTFHGFHSIFHGPSFALSWLFQNFIPLLKPDLLLVQSHETEEMFKRKNCKIEFLFNGVDTEKFRPVSIEDKARLREKYGVGKDKFVVLHVGTVKRWRNVQMLGKLQKGNNQIILIAGSFSNVGKEVYRSLEQRGCLVWRRYFEDIWEIYALSDCYVFPVVNKAGSIEMPLSVLEAMACNLPVISTRFRALPRVFKEGDGLIFVDKEEDFIDTLEKINETDTNIKTREKVLPYSWKNIGKKLEEIYLELIDGESK